MKTFDPDPVALFLYSHKNGCLQAEQGLGLTEKLLLCSPNDTLLLGCKAALLLIVSDGIEETENRDVFLRNSLNISQRSLQNAESNRAKYQICLMNGVAWARIPNSPHARKRSLEFFYCAPKLLQNSNPLFSLKLEALAAVAAIYQRQGEYSKSSKSLKNAREMDEAVAWRRFNFFQRIQSSIKNG